MKTIKHIYEAVEISDQERYYNVGVWLTLADAIAAIEKGADNPHRFDEWGHTDFGSFSIGIFKRKIGLSYLDNLIHEFTWTETYDETTDQSIWQFSSEKKHHD